MANDTTMTIVGNLTADPEIRVTPSGVSLARFTVASTPRVFDKAAGQYRDGEPLFLSCTAWRELAENTVESLTKGVRVVVTGRLRQSRWEDKETGEKRSMMQLDVDEIGPSLRFATATVNKLVRSGGDRLGGAPPDDPWVTASSTSTRAAGQPASGDDPPPF
jgi:single-strand DNA-binding protein